MRWNQPDVCAPPPGPPSHLLQASSLPPETKTHRQHREPVTYHNNKDDRASKTPDKRFMDGDPAEVRVPVALRVQPDSKAFEKRRSKAEVVYSKILTP